MRYQIHDIEELTGVKAHTFRIWEKRYNLIAPHRTETNIRYYDDEQVRRLLNVCTLVNAGRKISRVARLNETELAEQLRELQLSDSAQLSQASFITSLTSAMIAFDARGFEALIDQVIVRFGTIEAMTRVVYPFLVKVGVMWRTNEVMPAQEHFASCIIRNTLFRETQKLPASWKSDRKYLLFLPPNEWHEIGLLLSDYIVRSSGYPTVYLGQSVPFENVLQTCSFTHPTHLITFYFAPGRKNMLPAELTQLSQKIGTMRLIVCGRTEMLSAVPQNNQLSHCTSVDQMLMLLNS